MRQSACRLMSSCIKLWCNSWLPLSHLQVPQQRQTQEGHIPHRVQDLVAHALFREAQAPGIQDLPVIQHHRVVRDPPKARPRAWRYWTSLRNPKVRAEAISL